jgi:S1-C subfamily serine protease
MRSLVISLILTSLATANTSQPISAPITTELAGKSAPDAKAGVFKILNRKTNKQGTGFLHKSGYIITAAHVIEGASIADVSIVMPPANAVGVEEMKSDPLLDLAILKPDIVLPKRKSLPIIQADEIPTGTQVSTWGFPSGYNGTYSMLTVGHISGIDEEVRPDFGTIERFVVNAAFNSGNSGGPLLRIEDGAVVGVVCSKVTNEPVYLEGALKALQGQQSGFTYTEKLSDGSAVTVTEGQIVGMVLEHLRNQTQLVVGHAAPAQQLGIDP